MEVVIMLEQEQPGTSEERAGLDAAAEAPTRKRHGWLSALVAGMALVAVVAVFVAVFGAMAVGQHGTGTSGQSALGASAAPNIAWRVYRDPLGLYSIRIPANWKATASFGTFSEGSPAGSISGKTEDVQFSDPAPGAVSPTIEVHAEQINSAFGRQLYCGARSHETSTFNGYPAEQIPPAGTVWLFETYNAYFQIDAIIPGVLTPMNPGGPMNPPPTPTAPPQATVTAEQAILATTLASFKPAAKPLNCS
jgi:hypothetical protein